MRSFIVLLALSVLALVPATGLAGAASDIAPCSGEHTQTVLVPMNTVIFGSPLGWRAGQAPDTDGVESYYFHVVIPAAGCVAHAHVNSGALPDYAVSMHWFGQGWTHYEPVAGQPDQCDSLRLNTQDFSCPVSNPLIYWGVVDGMVGAQVSVTVTMSSS